jgi:hypothetical protein
MQNINTLDDPARTAAPGCAPWEHDETPAQAELRKQLRAEAFDDAFFKTKWKIEECLAGSRTQVSLLCADRLQQFSRGELFQFLTESADLEVLAMLLVPDRCIDDQDSVEILKDAIIDKAVKPTADYLADLAVEVF